MAWSYNEHCPHLYHLDCITDWLQTSLAVAAQQQQQQRRNRRGRHRPSEDDSNHHPRPSCPTCRQDFIARIPNDDDDDEDETHTAPPEQEEERRFVGSDDNV